MAYTRRQRPRRRAAEPQTAADLMSQVVARLGGESRAAEHRVFECFEAIVGAPLRNRAQADSLKGTTLFIKVTSSALAHELTLLRGTILDRMAEQLGPGVVTELRTRIGALPPAG